MRPTRMKELRDARRVGEKTLVPVVVGGRVRHIVRCWLKFKAERFTSRLNRLGLNASVGGKWVTDEYGCHFQEARRD